jgi:acyl-CoA dehydrogenase
MTMRRSLYTPDHEAFRASFRQFLDREAVPHTQRWEDTGLVDRSFFEAAGRNGFLGFEAPEEFGGLAIDDFRYNAIMSEEVVASGTAGDGFTLGNDILAPYLINLTTPEQRKRWLPGFTAGTTIPAIAMTEPTTGSDLAAVRTTARREADQYVVDGAKTFITNGVQADLVLVLARTGERDGRGLSLIAVEAGTPGFSKGNGLHKIGRKAQDTAELFFDHCRVPVHNLIGEPGSGMRTVLTNLPRERLSMAVIAVASAERALALAVSHCRDRTSFGVSLGSHQALRFELAEMHTEVGVARVFVDRCVQGLLDGELTAEDAAGAKYWTTDLQCSVIDRCLQLFGGYGYMEEYPIARMWRDARVQRIYGGTNEIMKEIVGRAVVAARVSGR